MQWQVRDRVTAQRPRRFSGILMMGALIAGAAAAGSLATSHAPAPVVFAAPAAGASLTHPDGGYADVVAKVAPAVVTVRSQRVLKVADQGPFGGQDPFEEFFGRQFPGRRPQVPPQPRREGALGSGVVVSADGYILTNNHVVEGSRQVEVEMTDGRTMKATVVGADAPSDLAVLKVEAKSLPTLPLADSDSVRVGDIALAVGNPLGVGQTVTMGIVSAKGRATGGGDSYEDFLQTDAPINQGNSGGALVNTRGELIGINSQILSPSGGNIGIGFAIPSNMAKNVMDQLVNGGAVHRGMLGVTVQGINSDLAGSLGLSGVKGALVSAVSEGGPAEKAGIERGDVIIAIDGQAVKDSNSLRNTVSRLKPGRTVGLTLFRNGQEKQVSARLAEMPRKASDDSSGSRAPAGTRGALGLALQPGDSGLEVTNVDPSGPAADAGIRVGDVLEEVNGSPVKSSADVHAALGKSKGKPALVLVRRGDQTLYVAVPERAA